MGKLKKSIVVKASPEKVWEMLALDRLLEWNEGYNEVKSVEYTSKVNTPEDKYRVGASAHGIPKKQGEPIKFNLEIIESLENEKITHRVHEKVYRGSVTVLTTYTLEPVETNTKITYVADYEMPWGILGKFLDPLFIKRSMEKAVGRELENLKNIVEK